MLIKKLKNIPNKPGIYLFYSKNGLVYVGKATELKKRVKTYFKISQKTQRPIEMMMHEVKDIKYKVTDSVLEAILLEGDYIKKYRPKYNIAWKDDKSWNYIVITKNDQYPRVLNLREHEKKKMTEKEEKNNYSHIFGPYPGLKTKEMMSLLRRLFFISVCRENAKRPCLYYEMGQCLGVCTKEISASDYKKQVIRPLVMFLRGNKKGLIKNLNTQMKAFAKAKKYEEAGRVRDQIKSLKKIQDIALINKSFVEDSTAPKKSFRIEGYDISNLGAIHKVGSMVVFDENGPIKKEYKKFNIKSVIGQSDVDCLKEVIERRLKHIEWPYPDVFLIDGGKPQINAVAKILKNEKVYIPIISIAKGPKRDKNQFFCNTNNIKFKKWIDNNKNLLINVRDEAHRFAISFSRYKRKSMLQ
jgi:excinuclease ABC subunit C